MVKWITRKKRKPEAGKPEKEENQDQQVLEIKPDRPSKREDSFEERDKKPTGETAKSKVEKQWSPESFPVDPQEGKTRFHDFELPDELMHAIADLDFKYCTPVQAKTLPHILKGEDVAGQAQTGTGKTAAFLLGIFSHMLRDQLKDERKNGTPTALVVAPTRELVVQLARDADKLAKYADISTIAVYGGLDYAKQEKQLRGQRVDLIAATPGRLIDYMRKRIVDLSSVKTLVLDEADRMLDMGFIPDVRRIISATPHKSKRQTLLFSATLDEPVTRLSSSWMKDPVRIEIDPENIAAESIDQKVYIVTDEKKYTLLYNILKDKKPKRAIIFANRRDQVDRLTAQLKAHDFKCNKLSGSVSQHRRMKTLDDFRAGKFNLMVATDVAGRGLHIDGITHIINFNVPQDPEDYVHRIGRTGRAGEIGTSITFACEKESFYLPPIEKILGEELEYTQPDDARLEKPPPSKPIYKKRPNDRDRRRGPRGPRKKR